jgi:hypothetical protein
MQLSPQECVKTLMLVSMSERDASGTLALPPQAARPNELPLASWQPLQAFRDARTKILSTRDHDRYRSSSWAISGCGRSDEATIVWDSALQPTVTPHEGYLGRDVVVNGDKKP